MKMSSLQKKLSGRVINFIAKTQFKECDWVQWCTVSSLALQKQGQKSLFEFQDSLVYAASSWAYRGPEWDPGSEKEKELKTEAWECRLDRGLLDTREILGSVSGTTKLGTE